MTTTLGTIKPLMDMISANLDDTSFIQFGSGYVTQKGYVSLHDYRRFAGVDTKDVNDMPVKIVYWGCKETAIYHCVNFMADGSILETEAHPDDHQATIDHCVWYRDHHSYAAEIRILCDMGR